MIFLYPPTPYLMDPTAQTGLGLLSLATYAKQLGADVQVISAQAMKWRDALKLVPPGELVLMGGCLVDAPMLNTLGRCLREQGCCVVVGGPVGISSDNLHEDSYDAVCVGPGEELIPELVAGHRPQHGLCICVMPDVRFDLFPPPDRRLLDNPGGNIYSAASGHATDRSTTLLTSRGCRFSCAFCSSGACFSHHDYPLERIEDEIDQIAALGIHDVRISDDNILTTTGRFEAVASMLKRRGILWRASLRVAPGSRKLYEFLRDCGCVELSFGVESADPVVLRTLRKGATIGQAEEAVTNAYNAGIPSVRALMMMGTPGENSRTLGLNKRFAATHPWALVSLAVFYPFPGTAIHEHPGRFNVRLTESRNPNIYTTRADESEAEANISIIGGFAREELTDNLRAFHDFLKERGQLNEG